MRINRAGACNSREHSWLRKTRSTPLNGRKIPCYRSAVTIAAQLAGAAYAVRKRWQAPAPIEFQLATKTRKCLTTHPQAGLPHQCAATRPDFNGKRPGSIRFVCTCALDAIVFVVGLLLAFGMAVVAGAVLNAI